MPKPSRPGTGMRLSSTAITSIKPRKASAPKKLMLVEVIMPRWPGHRKGMAISSAQSALPAGPASETSESQMRLRIAEWSM